MAYFSEEHKTELKRIFTELADFMHKHGIEQVVGDGPSATPYAKAVANAYAKRHDRKANVVNLGPLELAFRSSMHLGEHENILRILRRFRPNLDIKKKTLLLVEVSVTGSGTKDMHEMFEKLGIPHKTAALVTTKTIGNDWRGHDYIGTTSNVMGQNDLAPRVFLHRGEKFETTSQKPSEQYENLKRRGQIHIKKPDKSWARVMKEVRAELREVTNQIPKK